MFTCGHYNTNSPQRSIPVRRADGQVVGSVRGDVFSKRVKSSVHFLRTPPAIAFDTSTLLTAERAGAVWCEVYDLDTGRTYRASIHAVLQSGFSLNRGHGAQIALPLDRWVRDDETVGVQLAMFGGVA